MRVVLINRSDSMGGAAIVTVRLMKALAQLGVDARMLVIDRRSNDRNIQAVGSPLGNKVRFLLERLYIFLNDGLSRERLFKIDTGTCGIDISRHPWVRQADVVVLNWVNQAMLSLRDVAALAALGKPLVWTMHDMWNCTGVCHHAYECLRYQQTCHSCPLSGKKGLDISTSTQRRKQRLYSHYPITFVPVSHWLAACCRRSSLMKDARIEVIPNSIQADAYSYQRRHDSEICSVDVGKKVIVMGAARLDDPVKGFDLLIALTHLIKERNPLLASKLHLLLYGGIRDRTLLDRLELPFTYLGYAKDVNRIMTNADIVLSTSRYETLPTTLVEGLASGCIPVATGSGGQADIIDHLQNGYVTAGNQDVAGLAEGMEWAVAASMDRADLHACVVRKFDNSVVAGKYIGLFRTLLARH